MKVFISADIEGVTGTTHWDEVNLKNPEYARFAEQMTAEVVAACEGAFRAGAREVWVKDAHWTGRNLIPERLPREVKLVRGWSGHPYSMLDGLDDTFNAVMLIGYHSPALSNTNPLAHTMTGGVVQVRINDHLASEFLICAYIAGSLKVPVVFLSGDAGLCDHAKEFLPDLYTVAVKEGIGDSTINIHPELAVERIRTGAQQALQRSCDSCLLQMPKRFLVEIQYKEHPQARRASYYPGASLKDAATIQFEAKEAFEMFRFFSFVL